jgi:hypothetical protein
MSTRLGFVGSRTGLTRTPSGGTNAWLEVPDLRPVGFLSPILRTGDFHES